MEFQDSPPSKDSLEKLKMSMVPSAHLCDHSV